MINPDIREDPFRVSIIIPTYNVEKYIEKCLESLYQQTLRPEEFEIIIVDDNSSDNTLGIVKDFKKKRENIKIVHNKRKLGPGLCRNRGINDARGEFIYFLDADDYIDPVTLETMLITAYDNDADLVAASFNRVEENGNIIFSKDERSFYSGTKLNILKNVLKCKINHVVWNKMIKKTLLIENNIKFPSGLHEDVFFTFKLIFHAKNIEYQPGRNYYYWVRRDGSITSRISKTHIKDFVNGVIAPKEYIIQHTGGGMFRKLRNEFDIGIQVVVRISLRRIFEYYQDDCEERKKLYKYLYSILNASNTAHASLLVTSNQDDISYKFTEIFDHNENVDDAIRLYENYRESLIKQPEKQTIEKKEEQDTKKDSTKISKVIILIQKVLNRRGGIKEKFNYLVDRVIKYLYKKRSKRWMTKKKDDVKVLDLKTKETIVEDVLFVCDVDYHIRNTSSIIRKLNNAGVNSAVLDLTDLLNEGKRKLDSSELNEYSDIIIYKYTKELYNEISANPVKVAVFFNDTGMHNGVIRTLRRKGVITIGIDEGVNDFLKLSEGFCSRLSPYRITEHVFLPGEFEIQFFIDRLDQCHVVGLPMIRKLYKEGPTFPQKPLVAINVNFSYGVLTDCREKFVETAIRGCELAGVDYVITQHPMDRGFLTEYNMTDKNMYDTIRGCSVYVSRFSGSIIEALAMGKPCIYHNPHHEKVLKFQEPMGAYSISDSAESLAKAIKYELKRSSKTPVREYSRRFMEYHANIGDRLTPEERSTRTIMELLKKKETN